MGNRARPRDQQALRVTVVRVELAERSHDIVIESDLLERCAGQLAGLIAGRRVAVVTDAAVAGMYLSRLRSVLDELGVAWSSYLVEGAEQAKSFAGLEQLLDAMLADGIDRRCVLIAFGGGVVGDMGGFAAALLMRGIDLIQIPTTFLAQVDSAVGGKNAINTRQGKNLVGSFLQPMIVLNDVALLESLPPGEMRAGYGEVIKCALLRGETQFRWLEENVGSILEHDARAVIEAVRLGCETKARIVAQDERDHGKRALVNLGHTFAHAFEAQAGYGHVRHGAAVAVGLIGAAELSERAGLCPPGLAQRVRDHVYVAGLGIDLPSLSQAVPGSAALIQAHVAHDKKTFNGRTNFVLLRDLGDPVITADVAPEAVRATLTALGAE